MSNLKIHWKKVGQERNVLLQTSAERLLFLLSLPKTYYFPHDGNFGSSLFLGFWLLKMITTLCLWFNCLKPLPEEVTVKQLFCQHSWRETNTIPLAAGVPEGWGWTRAEGWWGMGIAWGGQHFRISFHWNRVLVETPLLLTLTHTSDFEKRVNVQGALNTWNTWKGNRGA